MNKNPAFPTTFIERYRNILPNIERLNFSTSPKRSVRVNTSKLDIPGFTLIAKKRNWQLKPIDWCPQGFWIEDSPQYPLTSSLEYFAGQFYIQEPASMLPPLVLDPQPNEVVLDLTAAPGSKTTQLSNLMENQGTLIANDKNSKRLGALAFNIEKQGCLDVAISSHPGEQLGKLAPETFDRVLLDAPCSAEGSLDKDTNFFKYWHENKIGQLAQVQRNLLVSALKSCKTGGTIVYSTCTLAPEENELNIQWLLENYGDHIELLDIPDLPASVHSHVSEWQGQQFSKKLSKTIRVLPSKNTWESFFIAKLRKTIPMKTTNEHAAKPKRASVSNSTKKQLSQYLAERFGFRPDFLDSYEIDQVKERLWIRNKDFDSRIGDRVGVDRYGLPLGRLTPKGIRLSFPFCLTFGHLAARNRVNLTEKKAFDFVRGKNPEIGNQAEASPGQVIVTVGPITLGRALLQKGNILKNQTPPAHVFRN